jgi:lipoprotein NlpI
MVVALVGGGEPTTAQPRPGLDTVLRQARALEAERNWPAALELYDRFLEKEGLSNDGAPPRELAYAHLARGSARFFAADLVGSVEDFDQVVKLDPASEPQLWQRGISYFYLERYQDCVRQFELHRTVNPNDVENPVWHLLCNVHVAGSLEQAQKAILPVGPDQRSPMREVYELFRGAAGVEVVRQAVTGGSASARFYAHLYLALWFEINGAEQESLAELRQAVDLDLPGYMPEVARVHLLLRNR